MEIPTSTIRSQSSNKDDGPPSFCKRADLKASPPSNTPPMSHPAEWIVADGSVVMMLARATIDVHKIYGVIRRERMKERGFDAISQFVSCCFSMKKPRNTKKHS